MAHNDDDDDDDDYPGGHFFDSTLRINEELHGRNTLAVRVTDGRSAALCSLLLNCFCRAYSSYRDTQSVALCIIHD